jgi:AraC-like DNA-binding protein
MTDPFAEIVALLRPRAPTSKIASGAGNWRVRREEFGRPFYCVILEGACRLAPDGAAPLLLAEGDFVLIPAAAGFTVDGAAACASGPADERVSFLPGPETRHGDPAGPAEVRMLVGYCEFESPDAHLLVSLLPRTIHVRGVDRMATYVGLVREETLAARPAREVVQAHLLEILLIEALRCGPANAASPGLVRGLADDRLATVLKKMHARPTHAWTVAELAKAAALSRSAFFERFSREVGAAPMEYLLAWRMAIAKDLLRRGGTGIGEVAEKVGYGSASAFSTAFARHVGMPPGRYARDEPLAQA